MVICGCIAEQIKKFHTLQQCLPDVISTKLLAQFLLRLIHLGLLSKDFRCKTSVDRYYNILVIAVSNFYEVNVQNAKLTPHLFQTA